MKRNLTERNPFASARSALPTVVAIMKARKKTMAIGLFLILVGRACALVLPISTKYLIDDIVVKRQPELLVPLLSVVLATTLLQAVLGVSTTRLFAKQTQQLVVEFRCKVQQHILRLPVGFHDANKTGALLQRTMSDVQGIQGFLGPSFMAFIGAIITSAMALVVMLRISVLMTVLAAGALTVFGIAVSRGTRKLRPIARRRAQIFAEVAGRLAEAYGGIRVLKGYQGEAREEEVFKEGVERIKVNTLRTAWISSSLGAMAVTTLGVVGVGIMYLGATSILDKSMTIGSFVTYTALMSFLAAPFAQIVSLGQLLTEALAGIDRTRQILANKREDEDPARVVTMKPIVGEVVFEDVHFAYSPEEPVLRGVSFKADPGTVTAFVGPSGSGKSTTIGLIAAFHNATTGQVRVDDIDLASVTLSSYRSQLGLVLQETFLFDGTILENVAFARPDANEEDILAACRTARVDEFAESLDLGYKTIVGERGVKLSGGQRQRISIARALLANPRILILDEATSSLDSHSEALIQEALSHLLKGRTTFVIAHRLSTIRQADQILVIEKGQIAEQGKHDELLAKKGAYHAMYTRQHAEEKNMFLAAGEGLDEPEEEDEPIAEIKEGGGGSSIMM